MSKEVEDARGVDLDKVIELAGGKTKLKQQFAGKPIESVFKHLVNVSHRVPGKHLDSSALMNWCEKNFHA